MTFFFRNRTIFWDILKWNRGQKKMGRREYYKFDWRLLGFTIYVRKWNIIPKVLMENQ